MTLIACPECERQVSTRAARCPGCGNPIAESQPAASTAARPRSPAQSATPPPSQPKRPGPATGRYYSDRQIRAAAFFGTILAGSHLIAANWRRIGRPDAASKTWFVGIATFVIAFTLGQIMPATAASQVSLASTLLYLAVAERLQKDQRDIVAQRTAEGAQIAGGWSVFAISLCYLAVVVTAVALTLL